MQEKGHAAYDLLIKWKFNVQKYILLTANGPIFIHKGPAHLRGSRLPLSVKPEKENRTQAQISYFQILPFPYTFSKTSTATLIPTVIRCRQLRLPEKLPRRPNPTTVSPRTAAATALRRGLRHRRRERP